MIRVAFCSQNGQYVDAHFASCPHLFVYEIGVRGARPLEKISFSEAEQGEEDRVARRLQALRGCSFLYCRQIGGPAAARLVQSGIYPLKAEAETTIAAASNRLEKLLQTNPPPWLKKQMFRKPIPEQSDVKGGSAHG
ncbi:dinitrogenase iron-molybdenum cofactor [Peptococcaceae bacterium CEB3]|nr:dinitrogenase iron-molybdenum cofactor [Peptococcaceae bacterium CEB3]